MQLSISNIAWPFEEENSYLQLIKELGCSGVEIAPSRVWKEPVNSSKEERLSYKAYVNKFGLEIPAIQALLYTRRELGLFREQSVEKETIEYLQGLSHVASDLGAKVLVFGSPANRKRGNISIDEAYERASQFFFTVGETAKELGVCVCIEPLGASETDFINSAIDGFKLVNLVKSDGFGLHLDAKALSEASENSLEVFSKVKEKLKHYHISEPNLAEINSSGVVDHISFSKHLHSISYNRFVSIEMRTLPDYNGTVRRSLQFSKKIYIDE